MQICDVLVSLRGDPRFTVLKEKVSVPEIAVLENMHGEGSCKILAVSGFEKCDHKEELNRLKGIYAPSGITDSKDPVTQLFPGLHPTLPTKLKELGKENPNMEDDEDEEDAPPAAKKKKKKAGKKKTGKKTAAKAEEEDEDEEGNPLE